MRIIEKIQGFLHSTEYYKTHDVKIKNDTKLIETGILDSFDLVRLINFLEEKFKISFKKEDLTQKNFCTIADISSLIKRRLKD